MVAMSAAMPCTISYWSSIDSCRGSRISALPPIAKTASPVEAIDVARGSGGNHRAECRNGLGETGKRCVRNAGPDLPDAGLAVRDAGIDDRKNARVDDAANIESGRRS